MAELDPCTGTPVTGAGQTRLSQIAASSLGITPSGVFEGTETLPSTSIPVSPPITNTGGVVGLSYGFGLTVSGGALTLNVSDFSPAPHASTHSPNGSDPLVASAFSGYFTPPVATDTQVGGVTIDGLGLDLLGDQLFVSVAANQPVQLIGGAVDFVTSTSFTTGGGGALEINPASASVLGGVLQASPDPTVLVSVSGVLSLPGVAAGAGSGAVVLDTTGSPQLRLSSAYEYTKVLSPGQVPLATASSPGSIIVGSSLAYSGGVLNLPNPLTSPYLPRANGTGLGAVFTNASSGLSISQGAVAVDLDGGSLSLGASGLKVTDDTYVPLGGTSTNVSGTIAFDDALAPAIDLGTSRIVMSGSPFVAAGLDSLLTQNEITTLISAASYGLTIQWHEPVQLVPDGVFPTSLTANTYYLTSVDSATAAPGVWSGNSCAFAFWDGTSWSYETPTVDTLFTVAETGDLWLLDVQSPSSPARTSFAIRYTFGDEATADTPGIASFPITGGLAVTGGEVTIRANTIADMTGLTLASSVSGGQTLKVSLAPNNSPGLDFDQRGNLEIVDGGVTTTKYGNRSITAVKLLADQVIGGTVDFLDTQFDGLTVKLAGDIADFRITGNPVSDATRPLIHTEDGISIAQESINTDALVDQSITFSKLGLPADSGLEDDDTDLIRIKLASGSGLNRTSSGLSINIHNPSSDGTIQVDDSTGGIRVRDGSLTSAAFVSGFGVPASAVPKEAPLVANASGNIIIDVASPIGVVADQLAILPNSITSTQVAAGGLNAASLNLASPSGIKGSPISLDVNSPEFAFSGNTLVLGTVTGSKVQLDSPSGLTSTAQGLSLDVGTEFEIAVTNELTLADEQVGFAKLDLARVRASGSSSPLLKAVGIEQFAGISPTPAHYTASPSAYLLSPNAVEPGWRVATLGREHEDYLGPDGQGKGTIEALGISVLQNGGTLLSADQDRIHRIVPTINSIGLRHLALGATILEPVDSNRLPTGLGSYKSLVQSGKLSSSPVTAKGWSPDALSAEIIAVKVGSGLTISTAGFVEADGITVGSFGLVSATDESGPVGVSAAPLGALSPSSPDSAWGLKYDTAYFTATAESGLGFNPPQKQLFTGVGIPAVSSGTYSFAVGSGSDNVLVGDSVEVSINGLTIDDRYFSYDLADTTRTVEVHRSMSPTSPSYLNLAYALSGSSPSDAVQIRYQTRLI